MTDSVAATRKIFPVFFLCVFLAALIGIAPGLAVAQTADDATAKDEVPIPEEVTVTTEHTLTLNGASIRYIATAGTIHLKNDDGDVIGNLYYTAYTKPDAKPAQRPISFIYNGGPGSASMWLHMGAFGPKRIVVNPDGSTPPPPYNLVANEGSLIDATDMVFIDPIGTGFSKVVGKGTGKDFWGIDEDATSLAQFVYQYITRNERWNSPKFLMGESYGTTRSAVLVNLLQNRYGMDFNGVVLISAVLDFETLLFADGHDTSYITFLPTYAITAMYHGAVAKPANLESWLEEVRAFAIDDYAHVLAAGSSAPKDKIAAVRRKLAEYTGLSEDYLTRANLRVTAGQFRAELQRMEGRVTSRLDARYDGFTNELLSENAPYDPQSTAISGAYTSAINQYLRNELNFQTTDQYRTSGGTSDWNWTRGSGGGWQGATNVAPDLAQAMIRNPNLKVQVENGYYDLATPFYATEWTTNHMNLPAELQGNLRHNFYEAGHMMYVRESDLLLLRKNVVSFVQEASGTPVVRTSGG